MTANETVQEALRAAPPLGVGGLTLMGFDLSTWVLLLTAVYTIILIIDKGLSLYRRFKEDK